MNAVDTVSTAAMAQLPVSCHAPTAAAGQKAEGEDIVGPGIDPFAGSRGPRLRCGHRAIAGQLGADELIVRHIAVESADDPFAPEMDARGGDHALVGVGITQHVEPVPGIADAVLLAGEQPIDHLFVGIRGGIVEKCVLFGRGRRNADEIEIHAPQERAPIGGAGRFQPLRLMLRGQKSIDRIARPGSGVRNHRRRDRLQIPRLRLRTVRRPQ